QTQGRMMSTFEMVKAELDKINRAIAEERSANDQRLSEVRKFGNALPETQAKLAKIEREIADLQNGVTDALKAAQRGQLGGGSNVERAGDIQAQAREFYAAKLGRAPKDEEIDVEGYRNYGKAFNAFIRRGGGKFADGLPADLRNELFVGSESDGGF